MGRFAKNYTLQTAAAVAGLGLALTVFSYVFKFADHPAWLAWWGNMFAMIPIGTPDGWNLYVMIFSPLVLIGGVWYVGEQILLRRKFARLLDTPKKSEFMSNKRDLEQLARQLPDGWSKRISEKEAEFTSKRAA